MTRIYRSIHDVLAAWGKRARAVPPQADALKQEIINRFVAAPAASPELSVHRPWFSLALAGLAVIMLFVSPSRFISLTPASLSVMDKSMSKSMSLEYTREYERDFVSPDVSNVVPERAPGAPITDAREFMKTNYHARLRSRDVAETWQRVQTLVRGTGGRVDAANLGQRYGYIAFAIPAEKFSAWRDELRAAVPLARFFTEDISAENLLPEKQVIESRTDEASEQFGRRRADRETLGRAHRRTIGLLQSKLAVITNKLSELDKVISDDAIEKANQAAHKQELIKEELNLRAQIKEENNVYAGKLAVLNGQISNAKSQLNQLARQDQALRDAVATVAGTISIDWISIFQIIALYLPAYWLSLLLLLAAAVAFWRHRRGQEVILP